MVSTSLYMQKKRSTKSTSSAKRRLTAARRFSGEAKEKQKRKEGLPTNEQIEEALKTTFGRVSVAARVVNLDRTTMYQRINKHPRLQKAVQEARSLVVPYTETKLMQNVAKGDQRAIEFVLKNKGKGWNFGAEDDATRPGYNLAQTIAAFEKALADARPAHFPPPPKREAIDITPNLGHSPQNGNYV